MKTQTCEIQLLCLHKKGQLLIVEAVSSNGGPYNVGYPPGRTNGS